MPVGTSNFLLLGLLENPNLPLTRPSPFPSQREAGWGIQEATTGPGEGECARLGERLNVHWLRCEAGETALQAKTLLGGSVFIILCTWESEGLGGGSGGGGGCFVTWPPSLLLCLSSNLTCLEAEKQNSSFFTQWQNQRKKSMPIEKDISANTELIFLPNMWAWAVNIVK